MKQSVKQPARQAQGEREALITREGRSAKCFLIQVLLPSRVTRTRRSPRSCLRFEWKTQKTYACPTCLLWSKHKVSAKCDKGGVHAWHFSDFTCMDGYVGTWWRDVSRITDLVVGFAIRELIMSNSARLVFITAIKANHVFWMQLSAGFNCLKFANFEFCFIRNIKDIITLNIFAYHIWGTVKRHGDW